MCSNCNCPESTDEVVYDCNSTVCEESYPASCTQYTDNVACTASEYTYTLPTNSLPVGTIVPTSTTSTDKTLVKATENIKDNFCFIYSKEFICQMISIISSDNELLCSFSKLVSDASGVSAECTSCS